MQPTQEIPGNTTAIPPTEAEVTAAIAAINNPERTAGVYQSNPDNYNASPEIVRREEVETRVGSLATGNAVGMASLSEEFADQQLHKFNFTAQQYADARAYEAEQMRQIAANFDNTASGEDDEDDDGPRGQANPVAKPLDTLKNRVK